MDTFSVPDVSSHTGHLLHSYLLKQRYCIIGVVGQGGFGAVYKAKDTLSNNRLVAVKEMSKSGLTPQEIAEAFDTFKREALVLADLNHPNLPMLYDHFTGAGRSYLVMDFTEGETLEEYILKDTIPFGSPGYAAPEQYG